jgi:ketosteroid isomerase-like protein
MSQENVEIVRRMAEVFNSGGADAIRRFFHPEIEWREDPTFPEAGVYQGVDAVAQYNEQFLAQFADISYEAHDLVDEGEHVIANIRVQGTGNASGAAFEVSAWWAFTCRDGQVFRVYSYLERGAALEAVGLSA